MGPFDPELGAQMLEILDQFVEPKAPLRQRRVAMAAKVIRDAGEAVLQVSDEPGPRGSPCADPVNKEKRRPVAFDGVNTVYRVSHLDPLTSRS
jgi:hypothetical protein